MQNEKKQAVDFLVPSSGKGGVETVINRIAGYLKRQGYRIRVVQMVFDGPLWLDGGIDFYPLRREKVDDIADFAPMYAEFVKQTYMPDLVIATPWPYMTLAAKQAMALLPQASAKIIAWLHAPLEVCQKYGVGGAECLSFADQIFVLNERSKIAIQRLLPEAYVKRVANPVDFSECQSVGAAVSRCLLFVGRLSEEKRVSVILDALAQTKTEWQLKIIGDGELRSTLEQQVQTLVIADRVTFLGWQKKPWEFAQGAAGLVLASEYEAFPLVAIEAMACGLPVFSTPVDGMIELIRPGENGFLYEKGAGSELAQLLDLYADGELPQIDPDICRASVEDYEAGKALCAFEQELQTVFDKISVIVPCYNVASLLPRCLNSVFGQQLSGVNLEVICVDDKSTDDTLTVLMEWESRYPQQLMVIPLEENGKQGRARNIALQYATGNYVTYVDADDALKEGYLQRLYDLMCEYNCEVAGCGYEMCVGDRHTQVPIVQKMTVFDLQNSVADMQSYLMQCGWKTSPWGRMYRTGFLRENDIYFAEHIFMEDILFSNLCLKHMKTYVHLPDELYLYEYNPNGTMASERVREYYLDTAIVMNRTADELLGCGRFDDCMDELGYVYFLKAFAEPISYMWRDPTCVSYRSYCYLTENVKKRFPEITENPYLKAATDPEILLAFSFYLGNLPSEEAFKAAIGSK